MASIWVRTVGRLVALGRHALRWYAVTSTTVIVAATSAASAQSDVDFDRDLAPVLQERCTFCHAGPGAAVGLALDTAEGLLAGSARGPVVVPGDPDASELIRRLRGEAQPRMPLTGPPWIDGEVIERFARWIADGAHAAGTPADGSSGEEAPAEDAPAEAATTPPAASEEGPASPVAASSPPTYADVAPIFGRHCVRCHAATGVMGPPPEGFRLDGYGVALDASDRARIVPFAPGASEVVRKIVGHSLPRMPFDGPPWLEDDEIDAIVAWIREGARDEAGTPAPVPVGAEVRLHGVWRADGTLDGLPLGLSGARIDDDARRGGYVQVRGVVTADGSVRVERLRGR